MPPNRAARRKAKQRAWSELAFVVRSQRLHLWLLFLVSVHIGLFLRFFNEPLYRSQSDLCAMTSLLLVAEFRTVSGSCGDSRLGG